MMNGCSLATSLIQAIEHINPGSLLLLAHFQARKQAPENECLGSTQMREDGENGSSHWLNEQLEFMFQGPGQVTCGKEQFQLCVCVSPG